MFACIANWHTGGTVRTSFHRTLAAAVERAQHNLGVVAIEEIGGGIVWKKEVPQ